ncbi:hypothetical protein RCL1_000397 [Eukaryota sp. TZLM3-RCL]
MFHIANLRSVLPSNISLENLRTISVEELRSHSSEDSMWVSVAGIVFDVTEYHKKHKGGSLCITKHAGDDCTSPYAMVHGYINPFRLPGFAEKIVGKLDIKERSTAVNRHLIPPRFGSNLL